MLASLEGKRVAILATDGFEQIELTRPLEALTRAGAKVEIVSPKAYEIQGFNHLEPSEMFPVDKRLSVQSRPIAHRRGRHALRPRLH